MPDLPGVSHSLPAMIDSAEEQEVNTNSVLQKVLQELCPDGRGKIILRCDELPLVHGDEKKYEKIFSLLLRMLMDNCEEKGQLYLHILCSRSTDVESTYTLRESYLLQFHTNLNPSSAWVTKNAQGIAEATSLLQKQAGQLYVGEENNTGCIFSVLLPCK